MAPVALCPTILVEDNIVDASVDCHLRNRINARPRQTVKDSTRDSFAVICVNDFSTENTGSLLLLRSKNCAHLQKRAE